MIFHTLSGSCSLDELKKTIENNKNKKIAIQFSASWCGPCKMIKPLIDGYAKNNDSVFVIYIDVDENQEIAKEYRVSSIPTFVFINKDSSEERLNGANFDLFKQKIENL
jgi:thioredoxin 1